MITVAAFYRFARLDAPAMLRPGLRALGAAHGLHGTILLAPEGINGTVAGSAEGIAALIDHLRGLPGCADLHWRRSEATAMPFGRFKVRLKREIVTMGHRTIDPAANSGIRVPPEDWNALIAAPDVAVIDTRNAYEVAIGSFRGAIDPGTAAFGDFPRWWRDNRAALAGRRVAMFCTGGIRCEKASAFLRAEGVPEVFQLDGGILGYLDHIPEDRSLWQGGCFVFDGRVALGHGLRPTGHSLCHGCRRPLAPDDLSHPLYEEGVACRHCAPGLGADRRARLRERHRQVMLATARGTAHLGAALAPVSPRVAPPPAGATPLPRAPQLHLGENTPSAAATSGAPLGPGTTPAPLSRRRARTAPTGRG